MCEENQNNDEEKLIFNTDSTPSQFNWLRCSVFSLWNIRHRAMNITVIILNERKWKIYRMQFILIPNLSIHSWTILICFGRFCVCCVVCVSFIESFFLLLKLNHRITQATTTTTTTTHCVHNRTNTCMKFLSIFFFSFILRSDWAVLYAAVYPKWEQKVEIVKNQKYLFNRLVSSRSWLHPMTFDVRRNIYIRLHSAFFCI